MTVTSLWHNFSGSVLQTVTEVVYSASKVHWTVQPTAARQSGRFRRCMGLCAHYMCLSTMHLQELSANDWNDHLITLQSGYIFGERRLKLVWNLHPKPNTVSGTIFHRSNFVWLFRVLEIVWQEYMKGSGRVSEHFPLLISVCSCLRVCTILNSWDKFL